MDVSENSGFSPQIIHFNIGISIIFTIHFAGFPLFLETPIYHPGTVEIVAESGGDCGILGGRADIEKPPEEFLHSQPFWALRTDVPLEDRIKGYTLED